MTPECKIGTNRCQRSQEQKPEQCQAIQLSPNSITLQPVLFLIKSSKEQNLIILYYYAPRL